jgi:hypothetical protein
MVENKTVVKLSPTFANELIDFLMDEADPFLDAWDKEGRPEFSKNKREYEYIFGLAQKLQTGLLKL